MDFVDTGLGRECFATASFARCRTGLEQDAAAAVVQAYTWNARNGQVWVLVRNDAIPNAGVESGRSIQVTLQAALAADQNAELESTATAYEDALTAGDRSLEVLMNLAILYWQATDPGICAGHHLSLEFFTTAARRFPELLEEGRRRFPMRTEPRFWQQYIAWADLGEPFSIDECRQLLREDPGNLLPAMYLFMSSAPDAVNREAEEEVRILLSKCLEDGTTRAKYVASVIQSGLRTLEWNRCRAGNCN